MDHLEERFSWINLLHKAELQKALSHHRLDTTGLVPQLRERLLHFMMYGPVEAGVSPAQTAALPRQLPLTHEIQVINQNAESTSTSEDEFSSIAEHRELLENDRREVRSTANPFSPVDVAPRNTVQNNLPLDETVARSTTPFRGFRDDTLINNSTLPVYQTENLPRRDHSPVRSIAVEADFPRTCNFHQQDENRRPPVDLTSVSEKVRSWNLRFDGRTDPESFLERLFKLQEGYGLENEQLYRALPELFVRDALIWYRNNRRLFYNWDTFLDTWTSYYLPVDYLERLEELISRTKQGPHEAGREYVAQMQTKIRRHGQYSRERELKIIYSNLRPEYRQYIRRHEVISIPSLIRMIDEFENLQRELNRNRPSTSNPNQNPSRPDIRSTVICYNCQESGHFSRNCPKPRRNQGNANRGTVPEGNGPTQ